jgi:uncharacterized phiE125 gp8 family phage protein
MSLTRTVAPIEHPVSIEEVKDHIRWESAAADEAQIMIYLRSAVEQMDGAAGLLNRALITQTWELTFDWFPRGAIRIPLPPLQSITSVQYIDTAGATQTLAASKYKVLNLNSPTRAGQIETAFGETWPSTRDEGEAVTVTFVAGYGLRNAVPEHIRHLLLFTIQDAYDGRAPVDAKPLTRTPAYQGLFNQARFQVVA